MVYPKLQQKIWHRKKGEIGSNEKSLERKESERMKKTILYIIAILIGIVIGVIIKKWIFELVIGTDMPNWLKYVLLRW